MAEIKFTIVKKIGMLSKTAKVRIPAKELNLISWNEREPKYDIREWSPDGQTMGKGVTLSIEELLALRDLLNSLDLSAPAPPQPVHKDKGSNPSLADEFTAALWHTVEVARKHNYVPTYFMQMLSECGGIETARLFLAKPGVQEGLMKLWDLGILSKSMEAVVIQEQFKPLFSEKKSLKLTAAWTS